MIVEEIVKLINGQFHTKFIENDVDYKKAFSCDLMSDCLAFVNENCLLITGLTNNQALRTAEMLDIDFIIIVRGKQPNTEMLALADEKRITMVSTDLTLYETSGRLYKQGLEALKL